MNRRQNKSGKNLANNMVGGDAINCGETRVGTAQRVNFVPFMIMGSLVFTTVVSALVLTGSYGSAETKNASITVSSACTMTTTGTGSYSATINNNTYDEIVGSPLNVECNDASGYSIYAIGYSNDSYTDNNTKMIASLGTDYNISTATSGNNSWWAMKVAGSGTNTPTIDNSFSSYQQIPATYTKISHVLNNTTNSITTPTYKVNISGTQAAGTYTGKVKYTVVHPNNADAPAMPQTTASGKICYYANAPDAVGTMGCQDVASSVMLLASNFSRAGYGFAGWSDAYDYDTNQNAHFYGPQEDIALTPSDYQSPNDGLSLYAVWVPSAGSLQDSSKVSQLCGTGTGGLTTAPTDGTANLSSVSALTDSRDNQTYAIAKLADGKCWMIENLRLEAENTRTAEKQALAQGYGTSTTYGNFSGLADAESTDFDSTYFANSLYSRDGSNDTINIGTSSYPGYRIPRYNNLNAQSRASSPTSNTFSDNNTTGGMYSYGNYYTWHAAIADTTYYTSGDHGTTSLCPTGWRLPIGNQSTATNSFGALSVALGGPTGGATADSSSTPTGTIISKTFRSYPNNFLYSGYFNMSSARSRGSYGSYWSSTAYDNYKSYYLQLYSSYVYPGTSDIRKYYGCSIRCTTGT